MQSTKKKCLYCGHLYDSYADYIDWCDACNWNIKPQPRVFFNVCYIREGCKKINNRYGKKLYEHILTIDAIQPSWNWHSLVVTFIAIIVFLLWLSLIALGVWLGSYYTNPFAWLGAMNPALILHTLLRRIVVVLPKAEVSFLLLTFLRRSVIKR